MTTGSTYHHELNGRVAHGWRALNDDAPVVEMFWTGVKGLLQPASVSSESTHLCRCEF
jgi:hypothetical protein